MVTIGPATPHELDDVLAVLDDAAAWLQAIGVTGQWPASFSGEPAWVERFRDWAGDGRLFIACDDAGAVVGCFRMMLSDRHIWGDDNGSNLYLHSLAVRRAVASAGIGAAMLTWACDYAARAGVAELRLDCWAGNDRLVRYYTDAGFESRGVALVAEGEGGMRSMPAYWVAKFAKRLRS
jgi:GNAT superfamily N-acetyltransferase